MRKHRHLINHWFHIRYVTLYTTVGVIRESEKANQFAAGKQFSGEGGGGINCFPTIFFRKSWPQSLFIGSFCTIVIPNVSKQTGKPSLWLFFPKYTILSTMYIMPSPRSPHPSVILRRSVISKCSHLLSTHHIGSVASYHRHRNAGDFCMANDWNRCWSRSRRGGR